MILTDEIKLNLKDKEVTEAILNAARLAMRDTVVKIANDAIRDSPWETGNNRRSIFFGIAGMGHNQASGEGRKEGDTWTGEDKSVIDDSKSEGAVYSTSGYGGYLETGTWKMAARPYFKPAMDKHFTKEKFVELMKDYLK